MNTFKVSQDNWGSFKKMDMEDTSFIFGANYFQNIDLSDQSRTND